MAVIFYCMNFYLLCDTPEQSEEGKLPPETLCFRNTRISKIRWHLYTGGTYNPGFTVDVPITSLPSDRGLIRLHIPQRSSFAVAREIPQTPYSNPTSRRKISLER